MNNNIPHGQREISYTGKVVNSLGKDAYYFSHDANARNDEKILMLRAEHGMSGYGLYWALIESMFENEDSKLRHDKIKGFAVSFGIEIEELDAVINTCISEKLFFSDGENFWSESLIRRKAKYQKNRESKSEAGKKGMAKRWGNVENTGLDNNVITEDNSVITKNNKGKESKVKEMKEKDIIESFFEGIWKLYPNKKGKSAVSQATRKKLYMLGEEKIIKAINNYKKEIQSRNTKPEFVMYGNTFFNSRYEDYLEESIVLEEALDLSPKPNDIKHWTD